MSQDEVLSDIQRRLERIERLAALSSKLVLTIEETALLTDYSVKYLYKLSYQRDIPHYKQGKRLFFHRTELERWMLRERVYTREEEAQAAEPRTSPNERPPRFRPGYLPTID